MILKKMKCRFVILKAYGFVVVVVVPTFAWCCCCYCFCVLFLTNTRIGTMWNMWKILIEVVDTFSVTKQYALCLCSCLSTVFRPWTFSKTIIWLPSCVHMKYNVKGTSITIFEYAQVANCLLIFWRWTWKAFLRWSLFFLHPTIVIFTTIGQQYFDLMPLSISFVKLIGPIIHFVSLTSRTLLVTLYHSF